MDYHPDSHMRIVKNQQVTAPILTGFSFYSHQPERVEKGQKGVRIEGAKIRAKMREFSSENGSDNELDKSLK
jgi:hypothetical protein